MRTRRAAWSSLGLWVIACGGAAPPVESAASDTSAEQPATAGPTSPAGEGDAESSGSAAATSEDDVNAVLQLVLDDPELDSHLKLGEPGRFPLKIAGEGLPGTLKLVKASEPVKLSEPPKSKKEAVLVFTEIAIAKDKATVRYRYDVEGIRGTVTLARSAHGWELKNSRVVEH